MKVEAECAACLLSRATAETYYATTNPALRFRTVKEVMKLLNREFRPTTVPADIGTKRDRLIKELTGSPDPYKRSKQMSNEKAVKLYPYAKKLVEKGYTQQERFKKACLCAIVGNILEFDIPGHRFTFQSLTKSFRDAAKDLVVDDIDEAYELVKKALAIQPMHQKALWLAGTATYQAKDYKSSLEYWDKLLQQFPKNSNEYVQMLRNIGEVKQLMGQPVDDVVAKLDAAKAAQPAATATDAGASGAGNAAAGGSSVSGEVSLDPSLQGQVSSNDTLFIFARAAKGPRMPLAILRMQASALPVKFTLDDSNAMNPAMRISNFPQVVVGARISKSGNAMPQDGDLSGASAVINVGAKDLKITINHAVGQNAAAQNSGAAAAASAAPVAASGAAVSGEVSIDPSLKSKVSPTDTLFIFARAAKGPRMPLAILRMQASALPVKFTLDDSNAMNPAMRLSNFKQVVVSARISKSGNAMPQSGDLSGDTSVINVGTKGLNVKIVNAVP